MLCQKITSRIKIYTGPVAIDLAEQALNELQEKKILRLFK